MFLRRFVPLLLLALPLAGCSGASQDPESNPTTPSADLAPRAVVEIVLGALQQNNQPEADAGIATAFAFASKGNRSQTGPLPRFAAMVKLGYAPLLNHRRSEVGPPITENNRLIFPVRVYPQEGPVRLYLFVLAESQAEGCRGCWLTDGVVDQTDQAPPEIAT